MKKRLIVHMIGNAHIDPVWLWRWQAGVDEALASFRAAADRCDEYPAFIFTRGEAWLYRQVEQIDPELFARVRSLIREGRWCIAGGQWIQPDTNLPTGEGWRRQVLHGMRYFQTRFGCAPRIGYNVDSFGHAATLPDLLSDFGFRGYVFHRPSPEQQALPAQTFRWRGPKGGELIGFRIAPCYVTRSADLYGQIMLAAEAADPALGHTMCFYGVGNHGGGPTRANIEYIIEHARSFAGLELRFSDPERFFDAVAGADLPVFDGELQHTFPGCYSVMHDIKQGQRRGEHLLEQAGRTIESFGGTAEDREKLDTAWEDLLFTQFHDILAGTSIESAWPSVRAMQGRAWIAGEEIVTGITRRWARRELPAINQQQIAVLNPLPERWRGWVEWEPFLDFDLWRDRWLSLTDGTPVPFQEIQPESQLSHFHRLTFPVDVPAHGSLLLLLRDDAPPVPTALPGTLTGSPDALANDLVTVGLGPSGLTSLRFREREILGGSGWTLHLREDPTDTWTFSTDRYTGPIRDSLASGVWQLEENGPWRVRATLHERLGKSPVRWTLTLHRGVPRLDMDLEINFQENYRLAQMPVALATQPSGRTDGQPGGSIRRDLGPTEWPVQNWSLLTWPDLSAALLTGDAYSLSCRPDCWQWTLLRSPRMAWDGLGTDRYSGRDVFTDQDVHRFGFALLLGNHLAEDAVQAAATAFLQPPVLFDRYEGMNRPPWGHVPPERLRTGAEQRAARRD